MTKEDNVKLISTKVGVLQNEYNQVRRQLELVDRHSLGISTFFLPGIVAISEKFRMGSTTDYFIVLAPILLGSIFALIIIFVPVSIRRSNRESSTPTSVEDRDHFLHLF